MRKRTYFCLALVFGCKGNTFFWHMQEKTQLFFIKCAKKSKKVFLSLSTFHFPQKSQKLYYTTYNTQKACFSAFHRDLKRGSRNELRPVDVASSKCDARVCGSKHRTPYKRRGCLLLASPAHLQHNLPTQIVNKPASMPLPSLHVRLAVLRTIGRKLRTIHCKLLRIALHLP